MPSKRSSWYWIFSNIFQNTPWHCKYFWPPHNTSGKDESPLSPTPPHLCRSLANTQTNTQIRLHNACQSAREKHCSRLFIDWPFESQHMPLCFYSTVFPEMDHFLILPQGFLPSSGVTRTPCKWSRNEFKLIRKVCSCACAHKSVCYFWTFKPILQNNARKTNQL